MFRNFTLALLGSASCLCAGIHPASAIDGAALPEPKIIYAREPAPPAPVRVASNTMGGGFIQFLFGDGPQSQRYQPDGAYQQQPGYYGPAAARDAAAILRCGRSGVARARSEI